jgi:hypothetical protein
MGISGIRETGRVWYAIIPSTTAAIKTIITAMGRVMRNLTIVVIKELRIEKNETEDGRPKTEDRSPKSEDGRNNDCVTSDSRLPTSDF